MGWNSRRIRFDGGGLGRRRRSGSQRVRQGSGVSGARAGDFSARAGRVSLLSLVFIAPAENATQRDAVARHRDVSRRLRSPNGGGTWLALPGREWIPGTRVDVACPALGALGRNSVLYCRIQPQRLCPSGGCGWLLGWLMVSGPQAASWWFFKGTSRLRSACWGGSLEIHLHGDLTYDRGVSLGSYAPVSRRAVIRDTQQLTARIYRADKADGSLHRPTPFPRSTSSS